MEDLDIDDEFYERADKINGINNSRPPLNTNYRPGTTSSSSNTGNQMRSKSGAILSGKRPISGHSVTADHFFQNFT